MKSLLAPLGAFALCASMATHAVATEAVTPAAVADRFVAALRQHDIKGAARLFAPGATRDTMAAELTLQRVDEVLGGFSTIHPIPVLPNGKSLRVEIPAQAAPPSGIRQFVQVRYASTAGDGKPVFYEVNLTAGASSPRVQSLALHFPTPDAQSTARAERLVNAIRR